MYTEWLHLQARWSCREYRHNESRLFFGIALTRYRLQSHWILQEGSVTMWHQVPMYKVLLSSFQWKNGSLAYCESQILDQHGDKYLQTAILKVGQCHSDHIKVETWFSYWFKDLCPLKASIYNSGIVMHPCRYNRIFVCFKTKPSWCRLIRKKYEYTTSKQYCEAAENDHAPVFARLSTPLGMIQLRAHTTSNQECLKYEMHKVGHCHKLSSSQQELQYMLICILIQRKSLARIVDRVCWSLEIDPESTFRWYVYMTLKVLYWIGHWL